MRPPGIPGGVGTSSSKSGKSRKALIEFQEGTGGPPGRMDGV